MTQQNCVWSWLVGSTHQALLKFDNWHINISINIWSTFPLFLVSNLRYTTFNLSPAHSGGVNLSKQGGKSKFRGVQKAKI